MCYGRNLATGEMIGIGEAVGIIAAQSIGEPGTQLTMRTFHTGGVAGQDITQGLPRVEELFEARIPKGKAEISHIDGIVEVINSESGRKVKVTSREALRHARSSCPRAPSCSPPPATSSNANQVSRRRPRATSRRRSRASLPGPTTGLVVRAEDVVEREYAIPHSAKLLVEDGQEIRAGDAITDGPINPQEYLDTRGKDAVQRYLVREVQRVYRSQGVTINDKHVEIIVRQMLKKVRIDQPGDLEQLPTELIDRLDFEEANDKVLSEGGEPATAQTVLLGVTKASLNTSSFLAAASFQETTRVLTEAAINGARDHLIGLKENVIIGKLIPAGSGAPQNIAALKERQRRAALEALAGEAIEGLGEAEYNPFLEDGTRPVDDETAGLALAATIAGADDDEAECEPVPRATTATGPRPRSAPSPRRSSTRSWRRRGRLRGGLIGAARHRRTRTDDRAPSGRQRRPGAPGAFDTRSSDDCYTSRPWPRRAPTRHGRRQPALQSSERSPVRTPGTGATAGPTTTSQPSNVKGAASPCRPSASSCATGGSRRSRRSRRPRCARTGTACASARCRSPAPPRSGASACRSGR